MTIPLPMSIRTWDVVAPFLTSTILPLSWLRALSFFMVYSFQEFVLMERCHRCFGRHQRLISIDALQRISPPSCLFDAVLKRGPFEEPRVSPYCGSAGAAKPCFASTRWPSIDRMKMANA